MLRYPGGNCQAVLIGASKVVGGEEFKTSLRGGVLHMQNLNNEQ